MEKGPVQVETENTTYPPAISTENYPLSKIRIERKFYYPVGYKGNRRKSISTKYHPTTIRKEEGKRLLLELMSKGMTFPSAAAFLRFKMGYKSRTTIYKWLEDPEFKDDVICSEWVALGIFEMLELQAAQGGQLLRETIEDEHRVGKSYRKDRRYVSRRWAAIDSRVVINALNRRGERLRKIDKLARDFEESMGRE